MYQLIHFFTQYNKTFISQHQQDTILGLQSTWPTRDHHKLALNAFFPLENFQN